MEVVISLFLFALAIGYVEYRFRSIRRDTDKEQSGAFDFFATKEELKKAVKQLKEQADADRLAVEERMESIEQKAFYAAEMKKEEEKKKLQEPAEDPDPSVVYFKWPADDGTFVDAQRQRFQTEDTYYMFRLDDSRTKAEFTFVTMSETQLSKANNSSKKYIERACSFVNAKSTKYSCTPGKAHLDRGRWVVDLKAKIEYK